MHIIPTFTHGRKHMIISTSSSSRFTKQCYAIRISIEVFDIPLNPLKSQGLILETIISRRYFISSTQESKCTLKYRKHHETKVCPHFDRYYINLPTRTCRLARFTSRIILLFIFFGYLPHLNELAREKLLTR